MIYASSHGYHFLIEEMMKIQKQYQWCKPLTYKSFDCKGGRKIGEKQVHEIIENIKSLSGPTFYPLILGSNNIRHKDENIIPYFRKIVKFANGFGKVHIVLVSILPSFMEDTAERFADTYLEICMDEEKKAFTCGLLSYRIPFFYEHANYNLTLANRI